MKGKNYGYSREGAKTILKLQSTVALNQAVLRIDRVFLEGVLHCQQPSKDGNGWSGKCPFCSGKTNSKKHSYNYYRPAYLTARDVGYVFHCCSCNQNLTVYKFLLQAFGEDRAQEYAQARWDAGEYCGGGWNCPLPQKIRKYLLDAKEKRHEAYKHEYEEKRRLNYQKKYGSLNPVETGQK